MNRKKVIIASGIAAAAVVVGVGSMYYVKHNQKQDTACKQTDIFFILMCGQKPGQNGQKHKITDDIPRPVSNYFHLLPHKISRVRARTHHRDRKCK